MDLVIEAEAIDAGLPYTHQVARAFFGSTPGVVFYAGRPSSNTSGVAFQDARLIWRIGEEDWRRAIDSIPVHTDAGRYQRSSDLLPLSTRQFRGDSPEIDEIINLKAIGAIDWKFILFAATPNVESTLGDELQDWLNRHQLGRQSRQALSHYLAAIGKHAANAFRLKGSLRDGIEHGGSILWIGVPPLAYHALEWPNVSGVVLIPHLSSRGPNGAWVITRGPMHPSSKRFSEIYAFMLMETGKRLQMFEIQDYGREFSILELFVSRELAQESANAMNDADSEDEDLPPVEVSKLSGEDLLNALASSDVVTIETDKDEEVERVLLSEFDHYGADREAILKRILSSLPHVRGKDDA